MVTTESVIGSTTGATGSVDPTPSRLGLVQESTDSLRLRRVSCQYPWVPREPDLPKTFGGGPSNVSK